MVDELAPGPGHAAADTFAAYAADVDAAALTTEDGSERQQEHEQGHRRTSASTRTQPGALDATPRSSSASFCRLALLGSASLWSPASEGGGIGTGGGTIVPVMGVLVSGSWSAGGSRHMKSSVGSVRQDCRRPPAAPPRPCTSLPVTTPSRGTHGAHHHPGRYADLVGQQRHRGGVLLVVADHLLVASTNPSESRSTS